MIKSSDLFSRTLPQSIGGKIVNFPLMRILISLLFIAPVFILHNLADKLIKQIPDPTSEWVRHFESLIMIILFIIAYTMYTKYIENRSAHEFSSTGAVREFGIGCAFGMGLIALVVGVLIIPGYIRFSGANSPLILLSGFFMFGILAFIEELLFRLILFRLFEELLGSWISIILVALLFGIAHLGNENASIFNSLAIALEAGILIAAAFMLTRRIWLIFGLHLGWNYMQSGVFGITVSGEAIDGFLVPQVAGPRILTGGEFGVEGSLIAVIICMAAGIYLSYRALNAGQVVKPLWRRNKTDFNIEQSLTE